MKTEEEFINSLSTEKLFEIVFKFSKSAENRPFVERNFEAIITRCSFDYDMYNYYTILCMKLNHIEVVKCEQIIDRTINKIFSKETKIFLLKNYKKMKEKGFIKRELLINEMIEELKSLDTSKSTVILFDLFVFPDFKIIFEEQHRIIATLIEAYQIYFPDIISSQIFKGSSIIGKLLKEEKENIIREYFKKLLEGKQISPRNIRMIGGGGSNIVYLINNLVFKIGETRHNRKIYINHRILASLLRKLEVSEEGKELFYVEIMKYAKTGDITPEERDELKQDLYEQGLIWEDDKLENCGLLADDDKNICTLPVDYIEVAGNIDTPYRKESFMKRERKVVVIDNDCIRYNPLKSSR